MDAERDVAATRPFFYGWVVVGGAFGVMFVGFGSAYSFGAFFEPLQRDFAASRGSISLVFSIAGFLYFCLGAAGGWLADRVGPRRVCLAGMLVVGAGLLGASLAPQLWQVYLAYGLGIGLGVGLGYVPSVGAVQCWFVRRRGFASGLAVAGIGLGTLLVPPLAAWLIDAFGWRGAYAALGAGAILLGGGAALLLEASPERRGLAPDGDPPHAAAATSAAADDGVGRALATRPFWLIYAGCFAVSLGLFIPFVHLVPYAQDLGLGRGTAVALFTLVGVGSTVGRFALGGIADRLGRRRSLGAMYAGMAVMLLWWLAATTAWELALFALLFGTCYGGFVALLPALTADYYAGRSLGAIIGLLYTSVAVGTLAGPTLAGVAFDLHGSYALPIAFSALACLVGAATVGALAEPAAWRARLPKGFR
jgi:MFS family permease